MENSAFINGFEKIIVFGGAGFIGSHLLQKLAADHPNTTLYSVDIAEPRFATKGVRYLKHDIRNSIPANLCGDGPALIINLAAVHTTPGHEDWEYYWTNGLGASHICQFAAETAVKHIIFTSSISIYGPSEAPKSEDDAPAPVSAYGRSKYIAEEQHAAWQAEDPATRRVTIARPAVIFGYTERGNFTRLGQLLSRGRFVYPGRTDTIKSCGYVKDLISSFFYMAERTTSTTRYNFCYPDRMTSADICAAFCDVTGYKRPTIVVPMGLMLLGGLAFEILSKFGLKTSINRPRVQKLFNSTNILPKRLQDSGFRFGYDIRAALVDWRKSSPKGDFL